MYQKGYCHTNADTDSNFNDSRDQKKTSTNLIFTNGKELMVRIWLNLKYPRIAFSFSMLAPNETFLVLKKGKCWSFNRITLRFAAKFYANFDKIWKFAGVQLSKFD